MARICPELGLERALVISSGIIYVDHLLCHSLNDLNGALKTCHELFPIVGEIDASLFACGSVTFACSSQKTRSVNDPVTRDHNLSG
jgi:predicted SAM-dependent methyltransferase